MNAFSGGPQAAQKRYYESEKGKAKRGRQRDYQREYQRKWRANNRTKVNAASIKHRHGKLESLAGRPRPTTCELCGQYSKKICWDHNHKTGKFRGWLCTPCNYILGRVKDSPALLRKLADYLEAHDDMAIELSAGNVRFFNRPNR